MVGVRQHGLWLAGALVILVTIGFAGADSKVWDVSWLAVDESWLGAGGNDINSKGVIGGTFADENYGFRPVYWDDDGWYQLDPPEGWDGAYGTVVHLSENGKMAGYVYDDYGYVAPVIWDAAKGTATDLNPFELDEDFYGGELFGLNERGDAVGFLVKAKDTPPYYLLEAFFWSKDGKNSGVLPMLDGFDCDESNARQVNASGDSVGKCFRRWDVQRAVLWPVKGGVVDLHAKLVEAFPDLDVAFTEAIDISDGGRVVGYIWASDYSEGWAWSWTEGGGCELLDRGDKIDAFPWAANGPWTGGRVGDPASEDVQACVWKNGDLDAIPLPDGYWFMEASGMNRHGEVAGYAGLEDDPDLFYPLPYRAEKVATKSK